MKKKLFLLIAASGLFLTSCTTSYQAASSYDDLYYTPGTAQVAPETVSRTEIIQPDNVGNNTYQMKSEPAGNDQRNFEEYNQYYSQSQEPDTTLKSDPVEEEYTEFDEEGISYEDRIDRFHRGVPYSSYYNNYYDYGYNSGFYDPYFGSSWSWGLGLGLSWGWGSLYYGYGYPYYGYRYPYSSWWYDPWYYPYYSYYPCYYCWDYYPGGGGYYPSPNYTYGPRKSRSPHNSPLDRAGRSGNNDENYAQVRSAGQGSSGNAGGETLKDQRENRSFQVGGQEQGRTGQAVNTNTTQPTREQRELKPNVSNASGNNNPIAADKITKPVNEQNQGKVVSQNSNTPAVTPVTQEKQPRNYSKPGTSGQQKYSSRTPQSYQQQKKYEKPAVTQERKSGQVQSYTPPAYTKPRSSKDYSNFGARTYKPETHQESKQNNTYSQPSKQNNVRNYSKPVQPKPGISQPSPRSNNNFSAPSTPQRSYSSPAPSSSPSRSYSTPSTSSPSRSSGSGSSGSSGSSPRKSR